MYSVNVLQRFHEPKFSGLPDNPTCVGTAGEVGDGPYLRLALTIQDNIITHAGFETYGCPAAIAAGSLVCELATGRTPEQIQSITSSTLMALLGGLPEGKEHCADLAVFALNKALQGVEDGIRFSV